MPASILIAGASTRSAAISAMRVGLQPVCIDLFADADLRACCPVRRVRADDYPAGLVRAAARVTDCPWMYTGGLENHPHVVEAISQQRTLWGNDSTALRITRSPDSIQEILRRANLPFVRSLLETAGLSKSESWLVKPLRGSGGMGIRHWHGEPLLTDGARQEYLQEFVEGESCSAVFVSGRRAVRLLGVTRQLIGEPWLHAGAFRYCGSIGPLQLSESLQRQLQNIGQALAEGAKLRGLFGVDCICRDDFVLPIEVNPRYTASIEVLEYSSGTSALAEHVHSFGGTAWPNAASSVRPACVGKTILFARDHCCFPEGGPWSSLLREPMLPRNMPAFADIPDAGESIPKGQPVLTCFAQAANAAACLDQLKQIAADLDRCLFGT